MESKGGGRGRERVKGGGRRKWLLHVQIRMCRVWRGNRGVEI